eukprot:m.13512 g.13512  ORF g.13512 m.13512 type:complete len:57 (-) comp8142_c0_seq2:2031-2201(-)
MDWIASFYDTTCVRIRIRIRMSSVRMPSEELAWWPLTGSSTPSGIYVRGGVRLVGE